MSNFYIVSTFRVKQSIEFYPLAMAYETNHTALPTATEIKNDPTLIKKLQHKPFPLWRVTVEGTLCNTENLRDEGNFYGNVAIVTYFNEINGTKIKEEPVTKEFWYNSVMPLAIKKQDNRFLPQTYDKKLEGIEGYSLSDHPVGLGMIYASERDVKGTIKNAEALAKDKKYILIEGYDPAKEKLKNIVEGEEKLDKVEITLKDKYATPEQNKRGYVSEKKAKEAQQKERAKTSKFDHSAIYG